VAEICLCAREFHVVSVPPQCKLTIMIPMHGDQSSAVIIKYLLHQVLRPLRYGFKEKMERNGCI
jgi:hypothetical protein